jgi:hypothetical protein
MPAMNCHYIAKLFIVTVLTFTTVASSALAGPREDFKQLVDAVKNGNSLSDQIAPESVKQMVQGLRDAEPGFKHTLTKWTLTASVWLAALLVPAVAAYAAFHDSFGVTSLSLSAAVGVAGNMGIKKATGLNPIKYMLILASGIYAMAINNLSSAMIGHFTAKEREFAAQKVNTDMRVKATFQKRFDAMATFLIVNREASLNADATLLLPRLKDIVAKGLRPWGIDPAAGWTIVDGFSSALETAANR